MANHQKLRSMTSNDALTPPAAPAVVSDREERPATAPAPTEKREIGGPAGLEPTRYGDWERKGRCIDF